MSERIESAFRVAWAASWVGFAACFSICGSIEGWKGLGVGWESGRYRFRQGRVVAEMNQSVGAIAFYAGRSAFTLLIVWGLVSIYWFVRYRAVESKTILDPLGGSGRTLRTAMNATGVLLFLPFLLYFVGWIFQ